MVALKYDGLIEPWKAALIVQRAKRVGIRGADLEDAQQEIVPRVAAFRYDPTRSNGATERTAISAVIDNCLKERLRAEARYRNHLERVGAGAKEGYDPTTDADRTQDVERVVGAFSFRERMVCDLLAAGHSTNDVARTLGWGWHTVGRTIRLIRERFEEAGLKVWVAPEEEMASIAGAQEEGS